MPAAYVGHLPRQETRPAPRLIVCQLLLRLPCCFDRSLSGLPPHNKPIISEVESKPAVEVNFEDTVLGNDLIFLKHSARNSARHCLSGLQRKADVHFSISYEIAVG